MTGVDGCTHGDGLCTLLLVINRHMSCLCCHRCCDNRTCAGLDWVGYTLGYGDNYDFLIPNIFTETMILQ